jgi:hypothetical protein
MARPIRSWGGGPEERFAHAAERETTVHEAEEFLAEIESLGSGDGVGGGLI